MELMKRLDSDLQFIPIGLLNGNIYTYTYLHAYIWGSGPRVISDTFRGDFRRPLNLQGVCGYCVLMAYSSHP